MKSREQLKQQILVTGATGFIGRPLCEKLLMTSKLVRGGIRETKHKVNLPIEVQSIPLGDIGSTNARSAALMGIDIVVHLAARTQVIKDTALEPLNEFRLVNTEGALVLARQAATSGVKRFIFVSSVKVNGEETQLGFPFTEKSLCEPQDPYGISKDEAEHGLKKIAEETGMELVIIRPPLVYGPGVKGNFASLISLVCKGLPLPLGAINNKRSLIGIDNLVDFIITCIDHPAAANQTFLISDGEDLSTTDLLKRIANAMEKPCRLLAVPASILDFGAKLLGKQAIAQRLLGSLQVDISKAKNLLGWEPAVSVDEGLKRCVSNRPLINPKKVSSIIRTLDIFFSALGLAVGAPLLMLLALIGLFDTGSPVFRQERVGKGIKPFVLIKFRTMRLDTASVASHLASATSITKFGHFLRRTKLDELPQLWNVLKGEMSLVGPRPCLFNQEELIHERAKRGVFNVRPGITGLAQINDIDMSTPELLAETDHKMIKSLCVKDYFYYIFSTVVGKGSGDRVKK